MSAGGPWLAAIGSYTADTAERGTGISLVRLVPAEGNFLPAGTLVADSPAFLTWDAAGRMLYAVHENSTGSVTSYRFSAGGLVPTGSVPSGGPSPCHVVVHPSGRFLVVSNYNGRTFASFPLDRDGTIGPASGVIEHQGRGLRPGRQEAPHPHSVNFTPDGRFAVLLDLGIDRISLHAVDLDRQALETEPKQTVLLPPGTGPRHSAWLAGNRLVVVGELNATLSTFIYDGGLREVGRSLPLRADGSTDDQPSEIATTPSGSVLVGNRTHGVLTEHEIRDGLMALVRELPLPAGAVRHLAVSGDWVYVALQDTDLVAQLDRTTGEVLGRLELGSPSCIAFRPSV